MQTWSRRLIHSVLAFMLLLWPALGTGIPIPISALILGVIIAYEGTEDLPIVRWTILLVIIELLYAMDLGLISLAFVLTVGLFALAGRWLNLRAWSREHGWALTSFIRTFLMALTAAVIISVLSVIIGSLVHGHEAFWSRLQLELGDWSWLGFEILIAVLTIVLLRRVDEPLHKHIIFDI